MCLLISVRTWAQGQTPLLTNFFFFLKRFYLYFFLFLFVVFLAMPCHIQDLSSSTRDQTRAPWVGRTES